jgi:hypothetical protein
MGPANEVPPSMPPSDFIVQHLDLIPSSEQQTATEHQPGDRGTHVILEESKAVEDKVSIVYIYLYKGNKHSNGKYTETKMCENLVWRCRELTPTLAIVQS